MNHIYLVTGAAGHLGRTITKQLMQTKHEVRVLVLPNEKHIPESTSLYFGDVTKMETMQACFEDLKGKSLIVIHCAGIVSIASKINPKLYEVNVKGTQNVIELCQRNRVKKLVYVSSVHAIAERPHGEMIKETIQFNPDKIVGAYAKTKTIATAHALAAAKAGLDVTVVHPSGIVGPYDYGYGHLTALIMDYYNQKLFVSVKGGYDFVDVRDVAQGVIAACHAGQQGECYILSNQYYTIKTILNMLHQITKKRQVKVSLPYWLVKPMAPFAERYYKILKQPPLFSAYSLYTLNTNAHFSHQKATQALGYTTRAMETTLKDTIEWLQAAGRI